MEDWRNKDFTLKAIGFIVLFAIFLVFEPEGYNEDERKRMYVEMTFDVKVKEIRHKWDSHDTYYYGKSSSGNDTTCAVPGLWGNAISFIRIGDSVKKEKGKYGIKVVRKHRVNYFPMTWKKELISDE